MPNFISENQIEQAMVQRLQEIIDKYNAGSTSRDRYYDELVRYTKALRRETKTRMFSA